tara:strand:- start:10 stop:210 length:201 start_codon:yes stop_codon:yes gene_type:complete
MSGQPITKKTIDYLKAIGIESLDQRLIEAVSNGYSFNQIINNKCPELKDFKRYNKDTLTWSIFINT